MHPSTPMTCSALTKFAHVVDNKHCVKPNGVDHVLNVPNYPMDLIKNDMANLRKEVNCDERLDNLR